MNPPDDLLRENQALRQRLALLSQASLSINESLDFRHGVAGASWTPPGPWPALTLRGDHRPCTMMPADAGDFLVLRHDQRTRRTRGSGDIPELAGASSEYLSRPSRAPAGPDHRLGHLRVPGPARVGCPRWR